MPTPRRFAGVLFVTTFPTLAGCTVSSEQAPPPPKPDPFLGYLNVLATYGEITNDPQGRAVFELVRSTFCPQGRDALVQFKETSSHPTDTPERQKFTNRKAADEMGAAWEFACSQGHDPDLYTPLPVKPNALDQPAPTTELTSTPAVDPNHCNDPAWWKTQQSGDPGTYVQLCCEWPSWVPQPQQTRSAPTAGYQCRPGDNAVYEVCAGHKEWVDGQREYADCQNGGGTWNIARQECDY